VTLVFPKAYKRLLHDIVRIRLGASPLARDEPEPGAVLGEPGPPILIGMGIGHERVIKESEAAGGFCLPKDDSDHRPYLVKAVANPETAP
jgi:hypothetical protein